MRSRTKIMISALVAGASLAAAAPASAQPYPQQRYDRGHQYYGNANAIARQIQQLQYRVERNDGRDRISEREAAGLRRSINDLNRQFRDYNRNGLNQRETRILQDRIAQIRSRLQYERRDNDGRRW